MSTLAPKSVEDALPDRDRVAECRAALDAAGVRYVLSCWIDLLGLPKTKPVPLEQWEELCRGNGPQFAVHSVSMVPELGPASPDQVAIPDLESLVVCPWDSRYAWVFADLFYEGEPYALCPRHRLKRQVAIAEEAGYSFHAGIEPEFIVMRYDDAGAAVKAFGDDSSPARDMHPRRQAFGYDAEFSLDSMEFLGELIDILTQLGWGVADVVAEGAYSQFELDFGYTDIVGAADRFTFLRVLLKEIAKKHGTFVTFMAKPSQGDWRSGAHINHSIQSLSRPGVNRFRGENGVWGEDVYRVLGGMIRHGRALTAVTCSTVNSYKGLVDRVAGFQGGTITWAPTHVCYGVNNRSAMYRLPQARWAIENRAADMSMNAYLAMAFTVGASLDGLTNDLDPGPPVKASLYDMSEEAIAGANIESLPSNLKEAIEAFDTSDLARSVLGETMHESYSRYKHDEWRRFHQHITDWELSEYLRFF